MIGTVMPLLAAASTSKHGSSSYFILIILVLFVVYFLFIRPQKQKQRRARDQGKNYAVGDEVVTVGGVVGRVVAVDADKVTIVTGDETVGFAAAGSEPTRLVMLKSAISRKTNPSSVSGGTVVEPPAPSPAPNGRVTSNGHATSNGHVTSNGHAAPGQIVETTAVDESAADAEPGATESEDTTS